MHTTIPISCIFEILTAAISIIWLLGKYTNSNSSLTARDCWVPKKIRCAQENTSGAGSRSNELPTRACFLPTESVLDKSLRHPGHSCLIHMFPIPSIASRLQKLFFFFWSTKSVMFYSRFRLNVYRRPEKQQTSRPNSEPFTFLSDT